jgi:hypothetical protein
MRISHDGLCTDLPTLLPPDIAERTPVTLTLKQGVMITTTLEQL